MATDSNDKDLTTVVASSVQSRPRVPDHELLRFIAKGGFGSVWLARNVMGTFRAVKVVFRAGFKTDHDYEREFEGLRRFEPVSRTHDDLMDILQVGRNDEAGYFFYVMEVADDLDSGQQINPDTYAAKTLGNELSRRGGRLPFAECLQLGLSVADGLRHLNDNGLIHRDIKPSNIIFVNGIPKIADIGLVTDVGASKSFAGTVGFVDPEAPPWTVQADIYSLGKVLYEISFGKDRQSFPVVPTDWEAFEERDRFLELNEVINKACDTRRRRYRTAAEMHADLLLLQAGQSVKRLRVLERRLALAKRIGLAACLALLLAAAAIHQARRTARQAVRRQAASYVTLGSQAMAQGDLIGSLPWFTAALRLEAGDFDREPTHRVRIGSVLRQCPRIVQMWFHDEPIRSLDVSPDGQQVVAGDERGNVLIWDMASGSQPATLRGHSRPVVSVAYSPDGHLIASASWDGTARVWDAITHREIYSPLVHPKDVLSVQFSPNGKFILTAADDDKARLFDAMTGEPTAEPFAHRSLNYAAFAPNGRSIATASYYNKNVLVWQASTNELIGGKNLLVWIAPTNQPTNRLIRHENLIYQVAVSPDGERMATASFDKTAGIWDARTGFQLHKLKHPLGVRSIRFSSDGAYVLTACDDLTARLWNVRTGDEASPPLKHSGYLFEAVFCPDGRRVVTATVQGIISVWDLSPNNWLPTPTKASYSTDGNLSVTFQTNVVQVRDAVTDGQLGTLEVTNFAVADVRLNYDGSRLLAISAKLPGAVKTDRWAQLWAWHGAGASPLAPPFICDDSITNAVLSRDGLKLVSFLETVAQLRDAATWRTNAPPLIHSNKVEMASWNSNAGVVLTWSKNVAYLWDPISGRSRALFHDGVVGYAEFSPDGRYVLTCCWDDQFTGLYAQVWETATGRRFGKALRHGDGVLHAAFSADGQRIVTSSEFKTAQIWEAGTSKLLRVLRHGDQVLASAFSPDRRWVVTACDDGTARVWEAENGEPVTPRIKFRWGPKIDTTAQFIGGQHGILMNRWRRGERAIASLPSETHTVETLEQMAQVLSGHRSDQMGSALPLEKQELRTAWTNLQVGFVIPLDVSPAALIRWHEGQAAMSEAAHDEFAALFHLERLVALQPPDQPLVPWHEAQAATNEAAKNWFALLFHLERLIALQPGDQNLRSRRDEAQKQWEKIKTM